MNKKKLVIMASTLILAAATVAGGTLAYFTHSVEVNNIVTMGNVKISIKEDTFIPANASNITPGQVIAKVPTITNEGSNDCYVRVKIDAWLTRDSIVMSDLPVTAEQLVTLLPGWTKGVGNGDEDYYYYNLRLGKRDLTKVFHDMTVPTSWGNKYQNLALNLNVTAHAIQADNFTPVTTPDLAPDARPNANLIIGWSGVVVEE